MTKRTFELLQDVKTMDLTAKAGTRGELMEYDKVWFDDGRFFYDLASVLRWKDWFKEVVEKEWEIVSYKSVWSDKIYSAKDLEFIKHDYGIHSVKRLSDNEVFSVGDRVVVHNEKDFFIIHGWKIETSYGLNAMMAVFTPATSRGLAASSIGLIAKDPSTLQDQSKRWQDTDVFVASVRALNAIADREKPDFRGLWSIAHVNDFQDELLALGYCIKKNEILPSSIQWKSDEKILFEGSSLKYAGEDYVLEKDIPKYIAALEVVNKRIADSKDESKFVWTDELVFEFTRYYNKGNHDESSVSEIIHKFKASKQPDPTKEEGKRVFHYFDTEDGKVKESDTPISATIKMQSSQPQNSKERIEVWLANDDSRPDSPYQRHLLSVKPKGTFFTSKQQSQIKQAIEEVLNPSEFPSEEIKRLTEQYKNMTDHLRKCKYTEEDLKKAFDAGRERQNILLGGSHNYQPPFYSKYPTFEDYKNKK